MKKLITLLFTFVLLLAGCSGGKEEISFATWDQSMTNAYEVIATEYEKEHPDVDITFETYTWEEYWTAMLQRAQTDDLPCVMTMHPSYYSEFGSSGKLLPMNDFYSTYGTTYGYTEEDFPEAPQYTTDGTLYAIPRDTAYTIYIYNKDLFDKAGVEYPQNGWNTEDFNKTLEDLKANLPEGVMPFYNTTDSQKALWGFVNKNGGMLPSAAGSYETPEVQAAVKEWWELTSKGYSKKPSETSDATNSLISGEFAMMAIGNWEISQYTADPTFLENSGIVHMPYFAEGKNRGLYNNNASSVSTSCGNPDTAKDFVGYLGTEENAMTFMENSDLISARKSDYSKFFEEKYSFYPEYNGVHENSVDSGFASPSLAAGVNEIIVEYNAKILEVSDYSEVEALMKEENEKIDALYN